MDGRNEAACWYPWLLTTTSIKKSSTPQMSQKNSISINKQNRWLDHVGEKYLRRMLFDLFCAWKYGHTVAERGIDHDRSHYLPWTSTIEPFLGRQIKRWKHSWVEKALFKQLIFFEHCPSSQMLASLDGQQVLLCGSLRGPISYLGWDKAGVQAASFASSSR